MPTLTFKVTLAEARAIRARALAEKGTVSHYLRARALPAEKPAARRLVMKRHPVSGAPYVASPIGPPVSREQIKAALAHFP
jgi:hypothetical protein